MKKIIRYILIFLLATNICQGQQFVNGNFDSNLANWVKGGVVNPYTEMDGNIKYIDLTGLSPNGNGGSISQNITFNSSGCFSISFKLGAYQAGTSPALYTSGIDISMKSNGVITNLGHFQAENQNNLYHIAWSAQRSNSFYVPGGTVEFIFTGNNGFTNAPNAIGIDDISLEVANGCVIPCVCNSSGLLPAGIIRNNIELNNFPRRKDTAQVLQGDKVRLELQVPCSNSGCGQHLVELLSPSNQVVSSSPTILNAFPLTECGIYKLRYIIQCGSEVCEKDTFYFNSRCCDCPPLPDIYYNTGPDLKEGKKIDCSKNSIIKIKCQQQVNIQAFANCQGDGCVNSKVNISVAGPGVNYSTAEEENALAFFAMQKGDYVVTTTSTCNNKSCTPCKVTFRVEECNCPPPLCCKTPMEVRLNKEEIKFQYAAETRVIIPFSLNGAGKKFTQLRASLVGFDLYSDNETCMDCYNDSKNWGSIYIGSIGGFTPSYTGQNLGAHSNVREVVFNSPAAQVVNSTQLNLGFVLPQAQTLDCCKVYADLYIKITYRDNDCNECDTIIPVRVSLVRTKNGKPVEINLPDSPLRNARGSKAKIKSTNSL